MSRPPRQRRPARREQGRSAWLPLIAALGIGVMLLGLLVGIIQGGATGDDSGSSGTGAQVQVTPGGEEATMRARLEKNPDDVDAMVILADLLTNTGRGQQAIPLYEQALQHRPDDEALHVAFGTMLMQYNYDLDAELQLKKAHDLSPNDPQPLYLLGQLYENDSPPRLDDARAMYRQAIDAAPDSVYASKAKDRIDQINATPMP